MREIKVSIARFERDRLPELLQGEIVPEQSISLSRLANEKFIAYELIAVWKSERDYLNPLPHFIVGSPEALSDLCAWSAAFMKDIGPLSGIIRLVEPYQVKALPKTVINKFNSHLEIVSRQVAIILAEVIARTSSGNFSDRIELKSCLSTVSFSIFLAENRGLKIDAKEISDRWTKARGLAQASEQNRVTKSVLSAYMLVNQDSYLKSSDVEHRNPELIFEPDSLENDYLKKLLNEPGFNRKPKEDLVKVIDYIIPKLIKNHADESLDYLPFAKLLTQTTSGLANQVALLGQSVSALPELVLLLGVLNGTSAAPDILSSYNGIGWKLISRLTEMLDPFKRPDCDISFEEAYMYSRINDNTKSLGNRQRVEIAWGINVEVIVNRGGTSTSSSSISSKSNVHQPEIIPAISSIERRLKDAMDMLRYLKDQQIDRKN
ncbi:hypothetical protein [Pantoea sp. DY-5]|uniref:hypothetical protein n=1 Tax=Pantoea sp. DY-5 TaxID=2871488 RepID=UPI001C96FB20|nr:hypothetical protein [Pantoea sp. DY-5]MBY4839565.1 hypothetical protein [Pantoea sp. DY-5]